MSTFTVPACTVVIPCYNGRDTVEAAVASVLAQTLADFHLVLVDDCSTDDTRDVLRRLAGSDSRITLVELTQNMGRSVARNTGSQRTTSPFLCFLDQDDTYDPQFLQSTTSILAASPWADAAKVLPNLNVDIDPVRYETLTMSLATTMLMRREAFEFVGGFPESEPFRKHPGGCEDVCFQQLFSLCFNTGTLQKKLFNYNHRPGNALDRYLQNTRVVDGKIEYPPKTELDEQVHAEINRLAAALRERIRKVVWSGIGRQS